MLKMVYMVFLLGHSLVTSVFFFFSGYSYSFHVDIFDQLKKKKLAVGLTKRGTFLGRVDPFLMTGSIQSLSYTGLAQNISCKYL